MGKFRYSVAKWLTSMELLKALDGYKEGDSLVRYVYGETTQLKITRNLLRIEKALGEYEQARIKRVKDLGVEGMRAGDPDNKPEDNLKIKAYLEAVNEMQKEEVELVLTDLTLKELQLEKNNIPRVVLASLAFIIPELEAGDKDE